MFKSLAPLFLVFWLAVAGTADQLYIRNQPFIGQLEGSLKDPTSLEVDIGDLAQALGKRLERVEGNWVLRLKASDPLPKMEVQANQLYVNGQRLEYRLDSDYRMVKLSEVAAALGAQLGPHPQPGSLELSFKPPAPQGYAASRYHLVFYGADWAPASKLFKPVLAQYDLRHVVPVIYVDCTQPRSSNYRNFIRYFNGDKIPYTVLLGPSNKVLRTWTGYQELGPFHLQVVEAMKQP